MQADYAKLSLAKQSKHANRVAAALVIVSFIAIVVLLLVLLLEKRQEKVAATPVAAVQIPPVPNKLISTVPDYQFYTELTDNSPAVP